MSQNPEIVKEPKILIIKIDEKNKLFLEIYKESFLKFIGEQDQKTESKDLMNTLISEINGINPHIIVVAAYNSLSCTKDHFLHHLTHLIDINYKDDRNKNYKKIDYTRINDDYILLKKADSVKTKNSSLSSCLLKRSENSKPFGYRIRIFKKYEERNLLNKIQKSVSKYGNNSSNHNESYNNNLINNNNLETKCKEKYCISKIGYKTYPNNGILFDMTVKNISKTIRYFFIICNENVKNNLFKKPNSDRTSNWINSGTVISVPYELQIFLIKDNTERIKCIKYPAYTKINLLKSKRSNFSNFKGVPYSSVKSFGTIGNTDRITYQLLDTETINPYLNQQEQFTEKQIINMKYRGIHLNQIKPYTRRET